MIFSYCNHLVEGKSYDDNSILLDTGSTVSAFRNTRMLTDIMDAGRTMRALTNGGHQDSREQGILPSFFPVWVNRGSRMNILAWRDVRKRFRITADTEKGDEIIVHLSNKKKMVFKETDGDLYVYNMSRNDKDTKNKISAYSFLTLVEANKKLYTNRQLKQADEAKRLYEHLGMPGYRRKFFRALSSIITSRTVQSP